MKTVEYLIDHVGYAATSAFAGYGAYHFMPEEVNLAYGLLVAALVGMMFMSMQETIETYKTILEATSEDDN